MKRVLVIVPFPMSEENRDQRRDQLKAVELGPDIAFEFESVRVAPKNYVSASDMALAEFGALEAGLRAEERGFDAVCIDTMSDSGMAALRSELSIPVIGPGRASVLMAMMLGRRFSIVAMWPHWKHLYIKTLTELGVESHCASIRWIDATPDNQSLLAGREDEVFPALEAVGGGQIAACFRASRRMAPTSFCWVRPPCIRRTRISSKRSPSRSSIPAR